MFSWKAVTIGGYGTGGVCVQLAVCSQGSWHGSVHSLEALFALAVTTGGRGRPNESAIAAKEIQTLGGGSLCWAYQLCWLNKLAFMMQNKQRVVLSSSNINTKIVALIHGCKTSLELIAEASERGQMRERISDYSMSLFKTVCLFPLPGYRLTARTSKCHVHSGSFSRGNWDHELFKVQVKVIKSHSCSTGGFALKRDSLETHKKSTNADTGR